MCPDKFETSTSTTRQSEISRLYGSIWSRIYTRKRTKNANCEITYRNAD